ncbi:MULTISPECIES: type II CAAX prenyl endopeptidase Rce1 family protein [Haloferacaceae]|uniref:Type II CAAX prenyl endopeptidase Rce1 family protein n=1 Tax=Halorubrum glutamatedens TaxID=2707018 RepID=A0ABD5QQP2_9EURY|nr:CPBP family glutamic-type intramembrane protease [Halobellus captivus]
MSDEASTWRAAARGGVALYVLGLVGVGALAIHSVPALRAIPELAALSYPMLVLVAAANSTVLLAVFVALGAATAPQTGLHSHVFAWASGGAPDWGAFRRSLPLAIGLGTVSYALVAVIDVAFAPFTGLESGESVAGTAALEELIASVPMRLLYGGITEEILLRWGVMAPIAFGLWWLRNRIGERTEAPSTAVLWVAIAGSAVAFGAGHLPALASAFALTTALVVRTVLLNAIVGVALGWLFWRRSLETAMVAHAAFHVVLVGVSVVGMLLL